MFINKTRNITDEVFPSRVEVDEFLLLTQNIKYREYPCTLKHIKVLPSRKFLFYFFCSFTEERRELERFECERL